MKLFNAGSFFNEENEKEFIKNIANISILPAFIEKAVEGEKNRLVFGNSILFKMIVKCLMNIKKHGLMKYKITK